MDTRLRALAGRQGGTFSVDEAHALGVPDPQLRRAVHSGDLVRVRRGAYADGLVWHAAGPEERYRLAITAIARTRPGEALSHHAALAVHGLPLWDHRPERVDLLADVGQAAHRRGLYVHPRGGVQPTEVDGVLVVPIARAVVRSALSMGVACAVAAGDAALHAGRVTQAELLAEVALRTPHEGRGRAHEAVLRMDPKAESVGESRTRMVVQDLGLSYESQVVMLDQNGCFVARVDFVVEGVVLEFDGRVKYQRQRDDSGASPAGTDGTQVLWLEKRREDRIRRLGHPVERVVWEDLDRPGLLGARIRQARAATLGARPRPRRATSSPAPEPHPLAEP